MNLIKVDILELYYRRMEFWGIVRHGEAIVGKFFDLNYKVMTIKFCHLINGAKKRNLMILTTSYDSRLMPFWICKL